MPSPLETLETLVAPVPGLADSISCPICSSGPIKLGELGGLSHHRCRDCGWEFSVTEELS